MSAPEARTRRRSPRPTGGAAAAVLALGLAAPATFAADPACPDLSAHAERVAVAGGSVTEILFAMGLGPTVIAADRTSNHPPEALELPSVGYVRDLSAEGLLSLEPTLVLGEHDMGPPAVLAQLEALGLPWHAVPESFDRAGIVAKIRCVGRLVGAEAEADRLVRALPPVAADDPGPDAPRGVVILRLAEGSPVAAGRDTSGNGLLRMAGARNVLDFEGWKPVSREALAQAAPDFVVITESGLEAAGGPAALMQHPALRLTPAARAGRVIAMDGMAMLGFGLRTVDAANTLRQRLGAGADPRTASAP